MQLVLDIDTEQIKNTRNLLLNFPKINKQRCHRQSEMWCIPTFYACWIRRWECSINRLCRGKRSNYLFANEDYFIASTLMRGASTFIFLSLNIDIFNSKAHTIKALFLICQIVQKCGIQPSFIFAFINNLRNQ